MTRLQQEEESRAQYAAEFGILDGLATAVEAFLQTLAINRNDGLGIIKSSLLLRLASGLEALGLLAARGFFSEAVGQKRSLMEALARLAALCKQPALLDEYLMQDQLNRRKIIRDIIDFRKSWPPEIPRNPSDDELEATLKEVDERVEDYNREAPRKLRDIKTFDWAEKGEVDHLFKGHYPISSQALHHAPRDLERRFVVMGDVLTGIAVGPEPGDIQTLLLDACKFVFVGLQWFAISVDIAVPEGIDELYHRHEEMYERLAESIDGGAEEP